MNAQPLLNQGCEQTAPIITVWVGRHVVECPRELLAQLQREREAYHTAIENSIRETESNALLTEAERIKADALAQPRTEGTARES